MVNRHDIDNGLSLMPKMFIMGGQGAAAGCQSKGL